MRIRFIFIFKGCKNGMLPSRNQGGSGPNTHSSRPSIEYQVPDSNIWMSRAARPLLCLGLSHSSPGSTLTAVAPAVATMAHRPRSIQACSSRNGSPILGARLLSGNSLSMLSTVSSQAM